MKKLYPLWVLMLIIFLSSNGYARGKTYTFSIKSALKDSRSNGRIDRHIRLSFGDRKHRGKIWTATRRTMNGSKSTSEACNRAFASAIIALQKRARKERKRSVVDIYSYRFKRKYSSSSRFVCERGRVFTAVTLRGRVR
ncbi:MAG: hypothetical protein P794_07825 [Epsilonproteobacteria bacterium (ex Lamellibrachia satsuma)]|nr:MAG: hypothetical protein P794_07825 [Epsilonproteobacteria bacterium (ex Lamellibrachia satsuma)]